MSENAMDGAVNMPLVSRSGPSRMKEAIQIRNIMGYIDRSKPYIQDFVGDLIYGEDGLDAPDVKCDDR